ncbi:MAG: alkaline phosphatase D family protein [Planctomycetota bacterium]|nr:MAG: alkaline phosphatase D family protein [Planctomycetota bacterium]
MKLLCFVSLVIQPSVAEPDTRQATGVKVGEVTDGSAIVWVRLTKEASRRADGIVYKAKRPVKWKKPTEEIIVNELEGSCPGAPGKVRLRYGDQRNLADSKTIPWVDVSAAADFTHQFRLNDLKPATVYYYTVETTGPGGSPKHGSLNGSFETAPKPDDYGDVTFTVITGQAYRDLDHPNGYHIYEAMGKLKPKFIIPTGDTVYYDSDMPIATTVELARYHWHRMYSYPRHIAFHLHVPGYWEKDDHDSCCNDNWPGMDTKLSRSMLPMTLDKGIKLFKEQVPMGEKTYRTYRWGKGLQVWLVEGRDFRSPNPMPDGPDKSIWGAEQKAWVKKTLLSSDADWKVLISPTPIVGPDRKSKADNHSNKAFAHEGNEFRRWAAKNLPDNFFMACGDRHWQYHSVHPETRVQEFSCGPVSDQHAAGTTGYIAEYHKFHRSKGGFLSVNTRLVEGKSKITFRFHDVHGKVVYEFSPVRSVEVKVN